LPDTSGGFVWVEEDPDVGRSQREKTRGTPQRCDQDLPLDGDRSNAIAIQREWLDGVEGLLEIGDQIPDRLQANREPNVIV
jgi:hypothetical protein